MPQTKIWLDRKSHFPLYQQIKEQIKSMILEDVLGGGMRLPTTRELAQTLGINRSTVVTAYNDLAAEGLISSHVGRGTVVSTKNHDNEKAYEDQPLNWSEYFIAAPKVETLSFYESYFSQFSHEDLISLALAVPDPEHYPLLDFKNAINKTLQEKRKSVFQLLPTEGYYPLREMLAEEVVSEGRTVSPEEVLITSGATQAIYLICRSFLVPGDIVVVENPTSTVGLVAFLTAQAKIIDIPTDDQGMRVDILENLLARQKVKLIYTIPTFQNPSGTVLSLERRLKLLGLAHKYQVPIIEEDPYSKLYYDKIPPKSLKSLDRHNSVIYVGTFSKILFQGLRSGWLVASGQVIRHLSVAKFLVDLQNSSLDQFVLNEFIRQGFLEKHLHKMRKIYSRKRDLLIAALSKYCPDAFKWNTPSGGICLWCQLTGGLNALDLLREAIYEKVIFIIGERFSSTGNHKEWMRLSFSYLSESQIEEGIRRLSRAVERLKTRYGKKGKRKHITETTKMPI